MKAIWLKYEAKFRIGMKKFDMVRHGNILMTVAAQLEASKQFTSHFPRGNGKVQLCLLYYFYASYHYSTTADLLTGGS